MEDPCDSKEQMDCAFNCTLHTSDFIDGLKCWLHVWGSCYLQEYQLLIVTIQAMDHRKRLGKKSLNPGLSVLNDGNVQRRAALELFIFLTEIRKLC